MSTMQAEPAARVRGAQARIQRAQDELQSINRALPADGLGHYQVPDGLDQLALLNTVAYLLVELGLVTEEEFIARKTEAFADAVEQAVANAREHRRGRVGLVLPGGATSTPPVT